MHAHDGYAASWDIGAILHEEARHKARALRGTLTCVVALHSIRAYE